MPQHNAQQVQSRMEEARLHVDSNRARREQKPGILVNLLRLAIVVTGIVVTILMFTQIVIRYVFGFSIYGLEELMSFFAIWLYFMGAAHGSWDRGHISASLVDVITKPGRVQQSIRVLACLLTVIISTWMAVWAAQYLINSYKRKLMSLEVGISMVWVNSAMFIGLALMSLYFLIELLEEWKVLRGRV